MKRIESQGLNCPIVINEVPVEEYEQFGIPTTPIRTAYTTDKEAIDILKSIGKVVLWKRRKDNLVSWIYDETPEEKHMRDFENATTALWFYHVLQVHQKEDSE